MQGKWFMLFVGCLLPGVVTAQPLERPVIMELFTSQGCSSCPPADAIVAEIARDRPEILPLTFHVTYWNNLGWQDPFSFPAATERQRRYVKISVSPEVYTPAMIVDGQQTVIGSDRPAVEAAVARAFAGAQHGVPVEIGRAAAGLQMTIAAGAGHGSVLLIGYDREHKTPVAREENGGRVLLEANIVRSMNVVGTWSGQELQLTTPTPVGERMAVILQADDGRILGAGRFDSPRV